jgi:hypothetical protein
VAVDSLHSAAQREQLMKLTTSQGDALQRLTSILPYVPFPSDVTRGCRAALGAMLGEEMVTAQWARLTPQMHEFVAKILFLLPVTPWGAKGPGMTAHRANTQARAAAAKAAEEERGKRFGFQDDDEVPHDEEAEAEDARTLRLTICVMDLLSKARLMFHLFDDDAEAAGRSRQHSVLPVQPDNPELCPYARKEGFEASDASTYSAVLLLLAPVNPSYLRKLYPQCLLLNDGGVGGEVREKLGHRIALRMLLGTAPTTPIAPWIAIPVIYTPYLALAAISKLGGPRSVMLRHPYAVKFTAAGGGEISCDADDLDEVLFCLLDPDEAAKSTRVSKRARSLVAAARFWPEGEGPHGQGAAVLLLEELVSSQPFTQDGRKGWFDATHRAYCVHQPGGASTAKALTSSDDTSAKGTAIVPANGGGGGGGGLHVLSGCCRFPLHNLACGATAHGGVHEQHSPQMPHAAQPLGPEMARGAFETRLPLPPLFDALHSVPLRELITHCLSSPQHALLHLVGLSILGNATAGARELHDDPNSLNFAHYEYFGRPFAVAASLWSEHQPLLEELLQPSYAQRYGKDYGALVQKSFIRHVVLPDLVCVASNALRPPNKWVTDRLKLLHQASQFEEVRNLANDVRQAFYSMAKTGKQNEHEPVANKEHMDILYDELLHGIPGATYQ